jgi:serine/threonine-protein kinase HipA
MAHVSYRLIAAHAYEQFFAVAREPLALDDRQMQEAFRRMAFNVAACNNDDHTKNISFLLPKSGRWGLAPAYDVTYAFNPKGPWTHQHLMSVNGKFADIGARDLLTVADRFMIPHAAQLLGEVEAAVQRWPEFAEQAGLPAERTLRIAGNHVHVEAPAQGAVRPGHAKPSGVANETPLPSAGARARSEKANG